MLSIFTLALEANEAREVSITGEYFEIRNALFPIALIELLDRTGGVVSRLENPEQSDFVKPGKFELVRITNGPTAQIVKHFFGSGDAGSRRTSGLVRIDGASDVSVIDGAKNRVLANRGFMQVANATAVVGQFPYVQLRNPPGSGVNLILDAVLGSGLTTGFMNVRLGVTAFATPVTYAQSKRAGGIVAKAETRSGNDAAILGGQIMVGGYFPANGQFSYKFSGPLVLGPNTAAFFQGAVGADLAVTLEFFEEPI